MSQPLCQRLRLTEAAVFADVVGCGKWKRIGVFDRQGVGRPPLSVGFGGTLDRSRLRHRSDAHSGRRNCRLPDDSRPVRICKKQPFRTASDRCYDSVMSGSAVNTPPR